MSIDQHYDSLLNQHQASIDKADSNRVLREEVIQNYIKDFKDQDDWMFDLKYEKVSKDQFFFELLGDSYSALRHQEDLTKALVMLLQGNATQAAWQVQETLANMIAEKL
jgi:type VI protein secretion system component VasK